MNYDDPKETMDSLMGKKMVGWGSSETMFHVVLDDGRVLVFMALGIVMEEGHVVH